MANYIWPEITKDTSMEEIKRIHKDIWNYVIEHGKKPRTPYIHNCVACEYVRQGFVIRCESCPIIWPDCKACLTDRSDGLYDRWILSGGRERDELARQIRDLPWRFETC